MGVTSSVPRPSDFSVAVPGPGWRTIFSDCTYMSFLNTLDMPLGMGAAMRTVAFEDAARRVDTAAAPRASGPTPVPLKLLTNAAIFLSVDLSSRAQHLHFRSTYQMLRN
mmetsp:Transcript_9409/g.19827  ORF Transcript_9409/g.19827 Transcript_9409/m.19827 type:complete len:109 (+) Transcript_9409:978-1304(+)